MAVDYNADFVKYFEDDTLAAEWVNRVVHNIAWRMFNRQQEWIYMSGELESGKPCIADNYFNVIREEVNRELALLKDSIVFGLLEAYISEDIDVTVDVAEILNDWNGVDYDPDDVEWNEGHRVIGITPVKKDK